MALEQAWIFLKAQLVDDWGEDDEDWCSDCAGTGVSMEDSAVYHTPESDEDGQRVAISDEDGERVAIGQRVPIPEEKRPAGTVEGSGGVSGQYYCNGPTNNGCIHGARLQDAHSKVPAESMKDPNEDEAQRSWFRRLKDRRIEDIVDRKLGTRTNTLGEKDE